MDKHTKTWLDRQPMWHGCDLCLAAITAFAVGFIVGLMIFK